LTDQEKWEMWKERIEDYQASGKSAAQWCRDHHVPESSFSTWKKKILASSKKKEVSPASTWIAVAPEVEVVETAAPITIRVRAIEIEVKPGYDAHHLQQVLRTVMAVC
jgi:hypothetical protein